MVEWATNFFLIIKKITIPLQRKWCYTQLRVAIGFTPPRGKLMIIQFASLLF